MKLKTARQDAHLTQEQLAKKAGVDPSLISRLERARRPPASYESIVRVARALGIPAEELFPIPNLRAATTATAS